MVAAAALRNVKAREQSKRAVIRCPAKLAGVIDLAPTIFGHAADNVSHMIGLLEGWHSIVGH